MLAETMLIISSQPDLNLGLDLILQWKKNMELGRRHYYMEYVCACRYPCTVEMSLLCCCVLCYVIV